MSKDTLTLPTNKKPRTEVKPVRKAKQKLVGHDILLDSAMRGSKQINLTTMAGESVEGTVNNFDKYTITIGQGTKAVCFYKHAVESFWVRQ